MSSSMPAAVDVGRPKDDDNELDDNELRVVVGVLRRERGGAGGAR